MSTLFINGKQVVINGLRKFENPQSRLVIILAVPFNKVILFSEDLINFIIWFISLFVRVVHGRKNVLIPFIELPTVFIAS